MTAITALRSLVITQVPLANDVTIDRILVEVARDFFEVTRAWRSSVTATVTADTLGVTLTPPTDGELVDIVAATLDEVTLVKKTQEQLDAIDPKWRTESQTSYYITTGDALNEVLIAPMSATTFTSGLAARVAWKPALGAATLDAVMVSKYSDALVAGALGKLFMIPGEPYNNVALASYYAGTYEQKRDEARQSAVDGRMQGVVRKVRYGGI